MTDYKRILQEELVLALGCTEPIAIALAAASAGQLLPEAIERIELFASVSVIKNANSVFVPQSGGRQGPRIAAALGALCANPQKSLRLLEDVTEDIRHQAAKLVDRGSVSLQVQPDETGVYIRVEVAGSKHRAVAVVSGAHDRVSLRQLDDSITLKLEPAAAGGPLADRSGMSLDGIFAYANEVDLTANPDLAALLQQQIDSNMAIAKESLNGAWGQQVGRTMLMMAHGRPEMEATALAAAASDARMAGCDAPVTINAGSGNQGLTGSVPVVHMAQQLGSSQEQLYRALILSNLLSIYQKQFIGKLSAFCGAVSAAAAAGCGVALLKGMPRAQIEMTLTNTLAVSGGILCDGAKGSCAMKIAVALQNAFLGLEMARNNQVFQPGDGIVGDDTEETIRHIGTVAAEGMAPTDKTILRIMTE